MANPGGTVVSLDEYFAGSDSLSRELFDAVRAAIESIGPATMRVTRSQVAFRRTVAFAWAWVPGRYLSGAPAPLILTVGLHRRDDSPRWKEVVEPRTGRFTHHLELRSPEDIDAEVIDWLREAWKLAT